MIFHKVAASARLHVKRHLFSKPAGGMTDSAPFEWLL